MIHPLHYSQAVTVNAGTMATGSGQVIATSTGIFPQQMISEPGKSTIMAQQSGYAPVNANQTMIFKQAGAAANQQSVFSSKAITTSQKEKTYTCQNQLTALQPNSFYVSTMPVQPSSQVFNGSHMGEISSQPQIITTQASNVLLNQAQLLGLQTVNPLQPGLSWAPSGLQFYQNPIMFFNQQSGIRMAMHLPVAAVPQPTPPTSFASTIEAPPSKKICKLLPILKNKIRPSSGVSPCSSNHPMTTIQAHVNQTLPTPVAQQKLMTVYQTGSNQVQIVNDQTISNGIESKPVSAQTKISLPQKSQAFVATYSKILPACVAPTPTIDVSAASTTPSILTIGSSTGASAPPSNTQLATTDAYVNQVPSTPVAQQKFVGVYPTDPNSVQIVNDETMSTGIEGKSASVETKISSPQKSQAKVTAFSKILQACIAPTSTVDVSVVSMASSPLTVQSSISVMTKSSVQVDTSVSPVDTITSSVPTVSSVDTITSSVPTISSVNTITSSVPTVSSIDTITSSVPTVSSVDTTTSNAPTVSSVPPDACLTNKVSSDFISKPLLPRAHNEAVFTSDQTNKTETVITIENLKPHQSIQQLTSGPVKDKQKAIVKPQVLTHVINGFIIQESSEPFPVSYSSLLDSPCRVLPPDILNSPEKREDTSKGGHGRHKKKKSRGRKRLRKQLLAEMGNANAVPAVEELSTHGNELTVSSTTGEINSAPENKLTVSYKMGEENSAPEKESTVSYKIGEKNFVPENQSTVSYKTGEENSAPGNQSTISYKTEEKNSAPENQSTISYKTGAENFAPENVSRVSYKTGEENSVPENESTVSYKTGGENSAPVYDSSNESPMEIDKPNDEVGKSKSDLSQKLPSKWTVEEVFEFIQNFPGCSDYADNFKSQEVDGQALLLLNDNHLMSLLCMKLGPALKLLSQIRSLEEKQSKCDVARILV